MRIRPIRPYIYKPILWFGVPLSDWKFIVILVAFSYGIPFILELQIWHLPVPLFTSLLALGGGVAFFNWSRHGRRPYWLQHSIQATLTRSSRRRRALPCDRQSDHYLIDSE